MNPPATDWETALNQHRQAVDSFTGIAAAIRPAEWERPRSDGKWSPGQVCEHVVLTYVTMVQELRGGPAMAIRTRWWQRILLRALLLPRILRTGRIPGGVRAPREARPGEHPRPQAQALAHLHSAAREFEEELTRAHARGGVRLTHPYFGAVGTAATLRFVEVHTLHHLGQLPVSGPRAEREA